MALPKIDTPLYELNLPISGKHISFRPFLVKEQKNLLMAYEADDAETINNNIKQILNNCLLTEKLDIEELPIVDIEFFFINLRARSVGEVIDAKYRCNADVDGKECGNIMDTKVNILDINLKKNESITDIIPITTSISIKMKYPTLATVKNASKVNDDTDLAIGMVADSIDCIYDAEQCYYAKESTREELMEFVGSLNASQFAKIEEFFDNLPKLDKTIEVKCSKCGFNHNIYFEGLESFFA